MIDFIFLILFLKLFDEINTTIVIENGQPKVETDYGTVYGKIERLKSGNEIFIFKGIPYAQSPVNNLRFEKPLQVEPFNSINATEFKPECVVFQKIETNQSKIEGQEDCLYMNIAIPRITTKMSPINKNPVMVLIVGGGFVRSRSNKFHTDHFHEHFVTHGIVYVTFHYRVGPLGYYSNNKKLSGNYALYDKIQALKFVKKIIHNFNGDSDRITVFGFSGGAIELSLLTFSHLINGLFKQTINFCGNGHTLLTRGKNNIKSSRNLEKQLGCDKIKDKLKCIKNKDIFDIWKYSAKEYISIPDDLESPIWSPTYYDDDILYNNTFENSLKYTDNIPGLYGMNTLEDTINGIQSVVEPGTKYCPLSALKAQNFSRTDMINTFKYLLKKDYVFGNRSDEVVNEVINFYDTQGDENSQHKYLQSYVQFLSDLHFGIGAIREAKLRAKYNRRIYFYLNKYIIKNYPLLNPLLVGTPHCFEAPLIFGEWASNPPPREDGKYGEVMEQFIQMWRTFVKYGIPKYNGTVLPQVTPYRVPYLILDNESEFGDNLWKDRSIFWETIAKKYGYDWITGNKYPI